MPQIASDKPTAKAIDQYISMRSEDTGSKIDPRLQNIIEGIFSRCIRDGEYKQVRRSQHMLVRITSPTSQAIGIALEAHRLDIVSQIYDQTNDPSLLSYAMEAVVDTAFSLSYRDEVLNFLFPLFPRPKSGEASPYAHALTRLLITLSNSSLTVYFLTSLIPNEKLLAYQFAFDLVESGAQDFLAAIRRELPEGDEVCCAIIAVDHVLILARPRKTSTTSFV